MDTSETYIKMCEKAEEIQPTTKPIATISDYIFIDRVGSFWHQTGIWSTDWNIYWLPRQDQLQEMVKGKMNFWQLVQSFWNWLWTKEEVTSDKSMEQLWLAFVMKEKFNKEWDGEGWIIGGTDART